jgi:anaphase-promoting complex subunit 8
VLAFKRNRDASVASRFYWARLRLQFCHPPTTSQSTLKMTELISFDQQTIKDLKSSIKECAEHALFSASKWYVNGPAEALSRGHPDTLCVGRSAELYRSIPLHRRRPLLPESPGFVSSSSPASPQINEPFFATQSAMAAQTLEFASNADMQIFSSTVSQNVHAPAVYWQPNTGLTHQIELEAFEQDSLTAALACFHSGEHHRVSLMLENCESAKAQFLSLYSRFLILDRDAQKQWRQVECECFSAQSRFLLHIECCSSPENSSCAVR